MEMHIAMQEKDEAGIWQQHFVKRAKGGVHAYLGTPVDEGLTFEPLIGMLEEKGWKGVALIVAARDSERLPWPALTMLAERILLRVTAGAEVLLAAGQGWRAHANRLDKMQAKLWLASLTGAAEPGVSWTVVWAEAGVTRRLSTQVIENAVLAQERLRLLPEQHPGRVVEAIAKTKERTWAAEVGRQRETWGVPAELSMARGGPRGHVKSALRKFRREEVAPRLDEDRDGRWWQEHGRGSGRHDFYYGLGGSAAEVAESLVRAGATAKEWRDFAEWSRARLLWVSRHEGGVRMEEDPCRAAEHQGVGEPPVATPEHLLACPGNTKWRQEILQRAEGRVQEDQEELALWLFRADHEDSLMRWHLSVWGAMARKQRGGPNKGSASRKRQEEAESERIRNEFLEWMRTEAGPRRASVHPSSAYG